jgi:molecular chaperone GrpE
VTDQAPDAEPRSLPPRPFADEGADLFSDAPDDAPADTPVDTPVEDHRSREELLAALVEAETARDEYLDDLRRARAEFDNYRRRMMRDGATQREAGRAELADGLLEVLDDLDRTLGAASTSPDETLARGVELVASKLRGALEAQGLERVDAVEVPFDPELHEAVQHCPDDEHTEPTVVEVLRPGYRWNERVLRAAMVVVAD